MLAILLDFNTIHQTKIKNILSIMMHFVIIATPQKSKTKTKFHFQSFSNIPKNSKYRKYKFNKFKSYLKSYLLFKNKLVVVFRPSLLSNKIIKNDSLSNGNYSRLLPTKLSLYYFFCNGRDN